MKDFATDIMDSELHIAVDGNNFDMTIYPVKHER